jgi:phage-related protein
MAGPIRISILANAKQATASIRGVENDVGRLGGRFTKLRAPAAAAAAGFVALGGGLLSLAKGAAEDEKAQATLAKQLKNSAGATDAQVKSVEDYISRVGAATGVTDDEMRPALANLVRATKDVGKAQSLMGLAMDVSAGTGKDLGAVSLALAKAQNGSVTGLSKLGIATKDASGKTKSFTQIQADLAKQFKGASAAAANTAAGKFERVKLQLAETGEALGARLLPAMVAVGNFLLTKFVPGLERALAFAERNKTTIGILAGVLGALVGTILLVNGAMAVWGGVMKAVAAATKIWAAAQWLINVALTANPIGLVVIAIAALVALIVLAYRRSDTFRRVVDGAFKAVRTAVGSVIGFFKSLPGSITKAVGDTAKTLVTKGKNLIVGLAKGYLSVITAPARFFGGLAVSIAKWVGDTAKTLVGRGKNLIIGLAKGYASVITSVVRFFGGLAGNIGRWVGDTTRTLLGKGKNLIYGIINGYAQVIGSVVRFFGGLAGNVSRWVGDTAGTLRGKGANLIHGIINGYASVIGSVVRFFGGLGGNIGRWVGNLGSVLYGAGRAVVQGLLNGIGSLAGRVADAARDLASKITGPVASLLRLGSPSRLFRQYGEWTVEGLADGIRRKATLAASASGRLAASVADSFGSPQLTTSLAVSGGSASGAGTGGGQVVINVYALQDGPEVGRRVVQTIRDYERINGTGWRQ